MVHVNRSWDEMTHTTPSGTSPKYQVPLSKYLGPEGGADVSLVTSRETKGDGFRQKNHGTR